MNLTQINKDVYQQLVSNQFEIEIKSLIDYFFISKYSLSNKSQEFVILF